MIIGSSSWSNFGLGISIAGDVTQQDIKQVEEAIKRDKPLEDLGFDTNFRIEQTPRDMSNIFSKTLSKFDMGISQLTNQISSLKRKLASLMRRKFKPWSLIREIKRKIKEYTKGLKNLKKLRSKYLNTKSKTQGVINKNIGHFTGSMEARDALYNRGAKLLSKFPQLQGDFRFLLTRFNISVPPEMVNQNPFINLGAFSMIGGMLGASALGVLSHAQLGFIMQVHDVNQLVSMLNLCISTHQNLMNNLTILNKAEAFESQKIMKLQMDMLRFTQAQSFAKMRKVFFKGKEMMFKGFSKILDKVSKVVNKMAVALEKAAAGLEAAANAAQSIPLVGPAIAAALRAAAKALRKIANMLKKASKVLQQKAKLMQNKANHMSKMQKLMNKRINFLQKLKNKTSQMLEQTRNNLLQIRERKKLVINNLKLNQMLMNMIIMRLRMLGENPMLPNLGFPNFPNQGLPLLPLGVPRVDMPGLGIMRPGLPIGMGLPSSIGLPVVTPPMNLPGTMINLGSGMFLGGIMLSLVNPMIGIPLMMTGLTSIMAGSTLGMQRGLMGINPSVLGQGLGPLAGSVSGIFRPTNVKQQAEQLLTQLAQNILNNRNNPQVHMYRQMLKHIYIQVAQRIDLSPQVKQLVSQAVGENLSHISPSTVGMITGASMGLMMGMFMGGPLGAIAGLAAGTIVGGITGTILGTMNRFIASAQLNYLGGIMLNATF